MPKLTDQMLEYMVRKGYLVVADDQDCSLKEQDETLYSLGEAPPKSDPEARAIYTEMYSEAFADELEVIVGPTHPSHHKSKRRPRR
jgi:hypothetical protein